MIGTGAERPACERLANALGVSDRVEFTGSLPHDDALRRLAGCDVLVSPHVGVPGTPFYGSPTKIFEYLGIGRPIVASGLGQLATVLTDQVNARVFPPGDLGAFAQAVRDVLGAPDRGASLAAAGRRAAEGEHSWTSRARAILDALERRGGVLPPGATDE
jgi:glycosyltransferase involved in cell wall biosynthesis